MKNKYKLMSEKLLLVISIENKRIITREEIKKYCKTLEADYYPMINYLLGNKYLVRILRGIFYINDLEERKSKPKISFYDAITKALEIKGIKNYYFGLESAIKLNNLTHEYFTIDYIINDKIKRPKPIDILGHKTKFLKIKPKLMKFGIKKEKIPYSDIEKTILDIVYFGIYNKKPIAYLKNKIIDYLSKSNKKKLNKYLKYYPKTVERIIQNDK